jgi:hypothetical protein
VRHSYDPRSRCLSPLARARSKGLVIYRFAALAQTIGTGIMAHLHLVVHTRLTP